ncbi:hypothetical protein [Spirulina subsalsa]|uniref:hypothetical protein n=1 Tax=Spirulina subsalsa TaxID=54311 RepID=UPI0002F33ECB|nr:hypothetical protein [Spirulina subsalsa]
MAHFAIEANDAQATETQGLGQDHGVWENLKQAIAKSSGFRRWQVQQQFGDAILERDLDQLVRRYLRETLDTLAY